MKYVEEDELMLQPTRKNEILMRMTKNWTVASGCQNVPRR